MFLSELLKSSQHNLTLVMSQIPCIMYPARSHLSDLKHGQRKFLSAHLLPRSCCNQILYSSKFSTAKPEISSSQAFLLCFYGDNTTNCKIQPHVWSANKSSQDLGEWPSLIRWVKVGVRAGKWTQEKYGWKHQEREVSDSQRGSKSKCNLNSKTRHSSSLSLQMCQKVMRCLYRTTLGGILKYWLQTLPRFQDPCILLLVIQAMLFPSIVIKGLVFYLNIKKI